MNFTAEWKAAKKAFEDSTKKSKPSATFLGVFSKGSGIEAATKAMDGAKTAGDLTKAIAKTDQVGSAYTQMLKKSAADPKAVPAADKATYVAAIGRLEAALDKILKSAQGVASELGGAGKKDKVDPAALKSEAEQKKLRSDAEAHYKLRVDSVADAKKILQKLEAVVANLGKLAAMANKAAGVAQAEGRANNQSGAMVQQGVISKCQDQADKLWKTVDAEYTKGVVAQGSAFMKGRLDFDGKAKLTEPFRKDYMARSVKAFAEGTDIVNECKNLKNEAIKLIGAIEAAENVAEAATGQAQKPDVYLARMKKVGEAFPLIEKDLTSYHNRAQGFGRQSIDALKEPPATALKAITNFLKQIADFETGLPRWEQRIAQLKAQATAVPRGAREDNAVDKAVLEVLGRCQDAQKLVDQARKTLGVEKAAIGKRLVEAQQKAKQPA